MHDVLKIAVTLLIATLGGFLALKAKVPAGAMIGALVFTVIFNLTFGLAYIPVPWKTFVQLCTGIVLGVKIRKEDVKGLRTLFVPLIILLSCMIIHNILFGSAMHVLGGLDLTTAMFAAAPGGMTDMAIIADELGANSSYVVILQLSRLMVIYMLFPPILRKIAKKQEKPKKAAAEIPTKEENLANKKPQLSTKQKTVHFLLSAASGAVVGILFWKLGITAGALLGGMVGSGAFNIFTGKGYVPKPCSKYLRILSGAYIGQKMTMASVLGMVDLIIPVIILDIGVVVFMFLVAHLMHRLSKENLFTCLFICSPGGVQEMSLLAEDLGADTTKTAIMQTARLASVIAIFPTMIKLATKFLTALGI